MVPLRGLYPQKITKLKEKKLLQMKYQHVADVVVDFIAVQRVYRELRGALNGTTNHKYSINVCRMIALLKRFNFATSKEPKSHSFWAIGLLSVSKEAKFCDLQNYKEFFFNFSNSEKIRRLEFQVFRQKCIFLKNNAKLEN